MKTDLEKIQDFVNELFDNGDEAILEAEFEEVPAFAKFEDCYSVNNFVKEEFEERGIELNYWNVKDLCESFYRRSKEEA